MSKYQPLSEHLAGRGGVEWSASFAELEGLLGFPLPKSARSSRSWWANDPARSHSRAWADRGWEVGDIDHAAERVVFRRGAACAIALQEVADLQPMADASTVQAPEATPSPPRPAKSVERTAPQTTGGPTRIPAAVISAGLAVVAGLGALTIRALVTSRRRR